MQTRQRSCPQPQEMKASKHLPGIIALSFVLAGIVGAAAPRTSTETAVGRPGVADVLSEDHLSDMVAGIGALEVQTSGQPYWDEQNEAARTLPLIPSIPKKAQSTKRFHIRPAPKNFRIAVKVEQLK